MLYCLRDEKKTIVPDVDNTLSRATLPTSTQSRVSPSVRTPNAGCICSWWSVLHLESEAAITTTYFQSATKTQ